MSSSLSWPSPSVTTDTRWVGLPPVVNVHTQILILGSFPGVASLQAQQYYAHPQNKLWPILAALWPQYPLPDRSDYAARCAWLLARGLGLWDVYGSCERIGSLDSAIRHPQLNDFAGLVQQCPKLTAVVHNGAASYQHAAQLAPWGLAAYKLPSTSPANAAMRWDDKLAAWHAVMQAQGLL